jgi:hypothetical protein
MRRTRLHLKRREQSGCVLLERAQIRGSSLVLRTQCRLTGLQRRQRPSLLVRQFRLRTELVLTTVQGFVCKRRVALSISWYCIPYVRPP